MLKVAILDDYSRVALRSADWSLLDDIAEITVFDRKLGEEEAAAALAPFDVLCTLRDRMALPATLLARLPRLKLITIIGMNLPNLDMAAATARGVLVVHPDFSRAEFTRTANGPPELAWGLILAAARHITFEDRAMRAGHWQSTSGIILAGRTLGLLGLGNIGKRMASYGQAFGMKVIAWSENLSDQTARDAGVRRVEKDQLFIEADVLSIHLQLSERSRHLVGARELALMKPGAYLVNTSRGAIVDEAALVAALQAHAIAGAGLDVYDEEPLPADHPFRRLDNATITPHLGFITEETMLAMYGDMPQAIAAFASGAPIRVINKPAATSPGPAQ